MLARVRVVAAARALPYHALARSWIVDALRTQGDTPVSVSSDEPQTVQLNIKLDQAVLDQLKARSDQLRYPYHRLAREWIELGARAARRHSDLTRRPHPCRPQKT